MEFGGEAFLVLLGYAQRVSPDEKTTQIGWLKAMLAMRCRR